MHDRARPSLSIPRPGARSTTPPPRGSSSSSSSSSAQGAAADDGEPVDQELFARLRALRAKLAAAEKLPAYCIFHDRTLSALARARPSSLDQMATISGVGPTKLAKYGEAFLTELRGDEAVSEPAAPD
jgi:ATP-dependent DNA helicase RecQ